MRAWSIVAALAWLPLLLPAVSLAANGYGATCRTGGPACLDAIDVTRPVATKPSIVLADGDVATVIAADRVDHYVFDADSGLAEAAPEVIKPDFAGGAAYSGAGRWVRSPVVAGETDPVFSAWDKSTGISITKSQVTDFGSYLTAESDPVFSAWDKSTGISITKSQVTDFGTYLTAESDPIFSAWDKSIGISITKSQVTDFGSYLTAETDPIFSAAEAALFVTGDKAKLDSLNPGGSQNAIAEVQGDTGSYVASSPISVVRIVGATGISTSVSGNVLTITIDPYLSGAMVRPGRAGGQTVYCGTGAGDDCAVVSTTNATKGSILLGSAPAVEIDEVTGNTVITGALIIK